MKPEKLWFDRKFEFDLPGWSFPGLLERVRGTPARLEDRLLGLEQAMLEAKTGDEWSIQENVGHLFDLEPLWLGRLEDINGGQKTMREADLTNRKTHQANHNLSDIDILLMSFRAAREEFVGRLEELEGDAFLKSALHPRLNKPMRILDMAYFVAEHDDHHLASITRLIHRIS